MYGLVPYGRRGSSILSTGFDDLYDVLDNFFADSRALSRTSGVPAFRVDVQEDDDRYTVEAELPGVQREEVDVEFNDGRLTISVRREERVDDEGKNYIHRERRMSSMARAMLLTDAAHDGIEAKLNDGVLTVSVPKAKKDERATKIEVS